MFGYIKPNKNKLTEESNFKYRSYYCSLCNGLSTDFGFISRFMVNYDITFALLCLDCLVENKKAYEGRCPINPLKRFCIELSENTLSFASFINYYLSREKLHDRVIDDNRKFTSIFYKAAYKISGRNKRYKQYCLHHKDLVTTLDSLMQTIYDMEKDCENRSADEYFNLFGHYLQHICDYYITSSDVEISNQQADSISNLFYNIGKWIYLMDAFDDYYDDIKCGRFNPLYNAQPVSKSELCSKENISMLCDQVTLMHQLLTSKIMYYLNSIELLNGNDIIRNILSIGCHRVFSVIMQEKHIALIDKENE